jgi:hypothetical protein
MLHNKLTVPQVLAQSGSLKLTSEKCSSLNRLTENNHKTHVQNRIKLIEIAALMAEGSTEIKR